MLLLVSYKSIKTAQLVSQCLIQQTELLESSAFPLLKDQFPSENHSKVFMEQIKIVKTIVGARTKLFIETIYCNSLQFSNGWCSWIIFITTGDLSWQFCLFWIFFSYLHGYIIYIHIKLIEPYNKIKSDVIVTLCSFVGMTIIIFAVVLIFYIN